MYSQMINWKKISLSLLIVSAVFLFLGPQTKASDQSDAIAVRVMPNPEHSSIDVWYAKQNFVGGSPQSLIVDGYEAIRDGRTVFIDAANLDSSNNKLYTNIYLISYNQESTEKTVDILGQLVSHWKFNSNVTAAGNCSISNQNCQSDTDCPKDYVCSNSTLQANQGKCILKDNKACLIDSDCPVNLFCDSLKAKMTRDVKRLGELSKIKSAIDDFKVNNGSYPKLQSGTYIPGSSVSVWPSWQDSFWSQLKIDQLLIDPINTLGYCSGYDSTTCWNKDKNQFVNSDLVLPFGSYAFIYRAAQSGNNYDLCGVFETKSAGYDTAEGQFNSNSCVVIGGGYSGSNSNTAPSFVSAYLNGETGKEFNGYVKAMDSQGDAIFWKLDTITPAGSWSGWSALPVLKDTGNLGQKKIYAAKAGNLGTYKMLLGLSDSRGATSSTELTFNISDAVKPKIEAENVDYFVDPVNKFNYTFYVQGSDSLPTFTFKPVSPELNSSINSDLSNATKTVTTVGLNRIKVDISVLLSTSDFIPRDITIPYRITANTNGSIATRDIDINLKMEQPFLDFQCENMARLGAPYQINNDTPRSCLLGNIKSGNHSLHYSVSSASGLTVRNDATNAYLESSAISGTLGDNPVKVSVANEYGASAEKTFNLKVNTFCGDGIKQKDNGPNTEGRGGLNNDGLEECDGIIGVQTDSISTSPDKQYGCTTESGNSPYPIVDNNSCVFKPADQGGGYCGDGVCQFKILVDGKSKQMENCWNCSQDCGSCLATIVSRADQEHIVYANSARLYKETRADYTATASTTLLAGKNVFSFWAHNLNDNGYGLAFKVIIGPAPSGQNATTTAFAEFDSNSSLLKCTKASSENPSQISTDNYDPATSELDGNINWTEIGYSKVWPDPVINTSKPSFESSPYIWSSDSPSVNGSIFCRLPFTYNSYNTNICQGSCAGKDCGSDGCGNSCGTCNFNQDCSSSSKCVCRSNCFNKCGGPDGCGGTCPDICQYPETCGGTGIYNVCGVNQVACIPSCSGKCGGPDGCGGACPETCSNGDGFNIECLAPQYRLCKEACTTYYCSPVHCGQSNGCGGTCSCGAGQYCSAGWCINTGYLID